MSCVICNKKEKGAEEKNLYICGKDVFALISMNREARRVWIRAFAKREGKEEATDFLRHAFYFPSSDGKIATVKLKLRKT